MDFTHHIVDVQGCLAAMARGDNRPETPWDAISQEHGPAGGVWTVVNRPLFENERPALSLASGPMVHIPVFPYQVVPNLECLLGFAICRAALLFGPLPRCPRAVHLALGHPVQTLEDGAHRYWLGIAFKE